MNNTYEVLGRQYVLPPNRGKLSQAGQYMIGIYRTDGLLNKTVSSLNTKNTKKY